MTKNLIIETKIFIYTILFGFLVIPTIAFAQQINVSGRVTSSNGEPLGGVSVSVQGASPQVATSTDVEGRYTIQVPQGAVLHYSFVGFLSVEETVGTRSRIDVILEVDEAALEEVVVVGYGTQRKVSLTGAVPGIKGSEMQQTRNEKPQNMLTDRVPGVRDWQRSAESGSLAAYVDMRGLGSSLVVIDGVPRISAVFLWCIPCNLGDVAVLIHASASIRAVRPATCVSLVSTR